MGLWFQYLLLSLCVLPHASTFSALSVKFFRLRNDLKIGSLPISSSRVSTKYGPMAGLREWIAKSLPFFSDLEAEGRDSYHHSGENRYRWKNAINHVLVGEGSTDEEKAAAARIRRAKLVAEDPNYRRRQYGTSASKKVIRQRLQKRMEQVATAWKSNLTAQTGSKLCEGAWGELSKPESEPENHARIQRSLQLQRDAARTLGARSRYFSASSSVEPTKQNEITEEFEASDIPDQDSKKLVQEQITQSSQVDRPSSVKFSNAEPARQTVKISSVNPRTTHRDISRGMPRGVSMDLPVFSLTDGRKVAQGDVLAASETAMADVGGVSARDLLHLPVLLEEPAERETDAVWKVIAQQGVWVAEGPNDDAPAVGRLRGMQTVPVEREAGAWVKLKGLEAWVKTQGGARGKEIYMVRVGKQLGFDELGRPRP